MKQENYKKIFQSKTAQEFSNILQQGCTRCSLSKHHCGPIVYRGSPSAPILLLGEAPGKVESELGTPFCGPAGKLLDRIFEVTTELNTNRDMILSNVSFCRPVAPDNSGKQNYTPKEEQLNICFPFIEKFIEIINPKILIACGRTALMQLTGDKRIKIGIWEGKWLNRNNIPMFVMTHPASLLHLSKWPDKLEEKKLQVKEYMEYFGRTYKEKYNYKI